jgi:hypothetical protein
MKPASNQRGVSAAGLAVLLALASSALSADPVQAKREAGHPATPVERLWVLSDAPDGEVRVMLGHNRKAPETLLAKLAKDPDMRVRIAVATNLSTPESIHRLLAHDAEPSVRSVVARFEYVPVTTLMVLADDPLVDIRLEVARNLNADARVLNKLLKDVDPQIRSIAEQALQRLADGA